MAMGAMSGYADVISIEMLRQVLPEQMALLEGLLVTYSVTWDAVAALAEFQDEDLIMEQLLESAASNEVQEAETESWLELRIAQFAEVVAALIVAFAALTRHLDCSSLELGIGYHNSEDHGSRYDQVDGVYFAVAGLYQLTPAGHEWVGKLQIERAFYVSHG